MYNIQHMQVENGFAQQIHGMFRFFQALSLAFEQAREAADIAVRYPRDQEAVRRIFFDE